MRSGSADMQKQNVLVVEDDLSLCNLISHSLHGAGLSVECTDSSVDAILKIQRHSFEVIVLDVMLGGTSGLYVVDAIRDIPVPDRPKVVIITGARGNILSTIDRNVVKAVLFKPLDVGSLAAFVRSMTSAGIQSVD